MPSIILADLEALIVFHEVVLSVSGGKDGVHDQKLLESAVKRPETYAQYVEDYDLDTICALSIDSIARYHGFKDGNKRTALMTTIYTYRINGIHFEATEEMNKDFDRLVMWIVRKKPGIEKITTRLKELRVLHQGDSKEEWPALLSAFANFKLRR